MLLNSELYYSKLMLFGEFSVILGSRAITVPYGHFKGELSFISDDKYTDYDYAVKSNHMLNEYVSEMKSVDKIENISCIIDLHKLQKDIKKGLFFESTIPQGYGLGSSGALTASIYSRYAIERIKQNRYLSSEVLVQLRIILGKLESYFHGTSSGIDPLSSYVKFPLLIQNRNETALVQLPKNRDYGTAGIFLIDTGKPRKTEDLVNKFMDWCKQESFYSFMDHEYIPINNACIDSILGGDLDIFKKSLRLLSQFQYQHFKEMIPNNFKDLWQEGLEKHAFFLKLCGAGGGGFLLGYAKDIDQVLKRIRKAKFHTVTVFRRSELK
jgi:mevalonate kinase